MSRMQKFLIVWGMHRSGTSLLSRALRVFGGQHSERMLANYHDNPTGYWEDWDLLKLNEAMLAALGLKWDSLDEIDKSHVSLLEQSGFINEAKQFLQNKNEPIVALKDPRMAKLGMFWKEVFAKFNIVPLNIIAYRNPLSVVHSLQGRKGIPQGENIQKREYCYKLWLAYTSCALQATHNLPRACVEYDIFLQYPKEILNKLSEKLRLHISDDEMQFFLQEFLNVNHRHNLYSISDLQSDPECPKEVVSLYTALLERAAKMEAPSNF